MLVVLLFSCPSQLQHAETKTGAVILLAKHLLEKRTGKVVAYGRLGWRPTSGTRALAHQNSTSALKAWR